MPGRIGTHSSAIAEKPVRRGLIETNFARFDARLEQRLADLGRAGDAAVDDRHDRMRRGSRLGYGSCGADGLDRR